MSNSNTENARMSDLFYEQFAVAAKGKAREYFTVNKFDGLKSAWFAFENGVFVLTDRSTPDYKGGQWEFADLKEGGSFFIHLNKDKTFILTNPNYDQKYNVDGRVLGLIMCLMRYSHASFEYNGHNKKLSQEYAEYYHNTCDAFYSLADKLCGELEDEDGNIIKATDSDGNEIMVSDEEKKSISDMVNIVASYLD